MMGEKAETKNQIPEPKDLLTEKLQEKPEKKNKKMRAIEQESDDLLTELDDAYKLLRKTQEELIIKEKLSMAGGLAAGVAHELRNSLNIIGISVQYLHDKFNPGDERREFTKAIMSKVEKLNSVTTDLIHFARPQNPQFKKANIHKILDRALDLVKFKCIVQKVRVVRNYATNLTPIEIDNESMEQVALNLIDNALWAMPERGKLIIATSMFDENNLIEIKFTDTGCGISRKDVSRIFDPFFTQRENGTGLGLSIVHRIIETHKGSIDVESELKKGTTFRIRLPALQKE
jgi:signal transduction histidine kinase